jgi:hypothetical protein
MGLLTEFSPRQELITLHFSKLLNALLSANPRSDFQGRSISCRAEHSRKLLDILNGLILMMMQVTGDTSRSDDWMKFTSLARESSRD